jgi:hypothetical protein
MGMRLLFVAFFFGVLSTSFAQTTGEYRSFQTGNWSDVNSWARWDGASWVNPAPAAPTSANAATITVRNTHTITVTAGVTVDQVVIQSGGAVVINSGVTLTMANGSGTDMNINSGGTLTNNGTFTLSTGLGFNIQVNGTLRSSGTISNANSSRLTFNSGSNYFHDFTDAGTIPLATWNASSTVNIVGFASGGSTAPSNLSQSFGNFVWNCPNQDATIDLAGAPSTVNGYFQVDDTGTDVLTYNFSGAGNTTLSITGDLTVNSGIFGFVSASGTGTLTVGGDIDIAGGFVQFADDADVTITCSGDFILSNTAQVEFSASTATVTLNLSGDFDQTGGDIFISGGACNLNFASGGTQIYNSSLTPGGTMNYTVNSGTTLLIASGDFVGGSGTFTLSSTATLQVGSTNASGAIQTGTSGGNIRVSGTRTYSSGSTIEYNGSSAQFLGSGHPGTAGVHTTINNSSGVTLASSVTIGGNLTLTSGNLTVGANTLTLLANVTANSNTINVISTSSLAINGSGALGTFPFASGDITITNFTLNRSTSGSVTFANNVTVTGALTLSNGTIIFNNQTLTLSGTTTRVSGTLSGNSSSILSISGSGAFGTIAFATGANTINTLTFDRNTSGTANINSTLTITNEFNLVEGDFTNTNGLTLDNGATLTRSATAQLLGSAVTVAAGEYYNVVYQDGDMTTGLELPSAEDDQLLSLTIDGGITLTKDIIVNGDMTLQSSTLIANGFDITMAAASGVWNKVAGTFTPGSGTVTITGSITVQGTSPQFGNLTVDSGGSLTLPTGITQISGNFQIDPAATFNHNSGRILFNGSSTQGLAGADKTFNNIRVNKTGGNLQLLSAVNLIGELHVQSATQVESNGSLTLISTSDAASGNACIAQLATGASVTGDVNAQRYMSSEGRIYRYISSPVSGATVAMLQDDFAVTGAFTGTSYPCTGCTNNASMFYYNEAATGSLDNGYVDFPTAANTETLTVGLGYVPFIRQDIVAGPITIDVTGTVNQGTISLPVTFTSSAGATNDGWNLVGNPYPSSVDWDIIAGWTKTNISNTIAVRDNGSGGVYQYWNGSTGGLSNGIIATGQGFWVQTTAASPGLVINEAAKTSTTGAFFRESTDPVDVLEISLSKGLVTDKAYFQVHSEAVPGFDKYDGRKLDNVSFDLSIHTTSGLMAINATNKTPLNGESIKIRIKDMAKGTYSVSLNKLGKMNGYQYFLLDRYTKKTIDMQLTPVYTFSVTTAAVSSAADRFELFMYVVEDQASLASSTLRADVHPNPATGTVYIHVTTPELKGVHLLNSLGYKMADVPMVHIKDNDWEGSADLTESPVGLYFVRVFDSTGKIHNLKILKK